MNKLIKNSYKLVRILNDIEKILTSKIFKRLINKWIGRNIIKNLWINNLTFS